jgi:hypothetical protein
MTVAAREVLADCCIAGPEQWHLFILMPVTGLRHPYGI